MNVQVILHVKNSCEFSVSVNRVNGFWLGMPVHLFSHKEFRY